MDANIAIDAAAAPCPEKSDAEWESLRSLLDRVFQGSPGAAEALQQQYGSYIIRVVRRRLPRRLRPQFDSIDFVQDVWTSFFRASGHDFKGPEHLIAYLTLVARAKVVDATRAGLQALKRDARREVPLANGTDGHEEQKLYARDGTPSEDAIGRELWEQLLEGQPPAYRKVLMMLRDGRSQVEVAAELNLNRKTIQRILTRALEKTGHARP